MEANLAARPQTSKTAFKVLGAISFSHFLNDTIQSLMLAIYPLFKMEFGLSFAQIGMITLAFQFTASLLQPVVGFYTDRHPKPFSLAIGMGCTLIGLLVLSMVASFPAVLLAAALVGTGSAIFHPESARVARMASGGQHGLAQSIFQVGGNAGSATGPLLAAWIVLPYGQRSIAGFSLIALLAMIVLIGVGRWYRQHQRKPSIISRSSGDALPSLHVARTLTVLIALIFSKFFYLASINSYLIFYLMHQYNLDTKSAQYHLFYFLLSVAAGSLLGGPIGDRIGRRQVIWVSILGVAPFTLFLPYVGPDLSVALTMIIGFMLASAFPAILVYAQELFPGKIGTVSGLFFGLAFGLAGIGAAVLGQLADLWGIVTVYKICAFLPLIGLLAVFLPNLRQPAPLTTASEKTKA
ncbi:MFS transporter [Propionivibrio dicarboxylicus]|uniref:MFS transporter, FSR family, fosmidomycin resistance protein n=1 Tax=Propionivibrio dicarboxylicus TaxID=83767 RepID=A0A1G8F2C9_9RHOO|nr:MFS transporter [Propionivibrio dicarboxylicus]SDH76254.1 MFS transporter, FSR family, fosmidomycin resistance protein [Propionivibrio dicarboxylicus]